MSDYDLVIGKDGAPALLLQGASVVDPDTRSGNPRHEIGTGRFGHGPGKTDRRAATRDRRVVVRREGQRPDEIRRRDAVVDAARSISDITDTAALTEFMTKRWAGRRAMTQADIQSFINDVHSQRIQDVIDALDNRVRAGVLRKAKVVNIHFPRGWVKATLRGLPDQDVKEVLSRLRSRGWSEQEIRQHVVQRFDDDRKRLAGLRAGVESD